MPATVTLATTTLAQDVDSSSAVITLASTAGVNPGVRLWVDRELMMALSLGINSQVNVLRGRDGTAGTAHIASAVVTIGTADQFYQSDPVGVPPASILVSPYINTFTGNVWYAQGDTGPGSVRYWQKAAPTYTSGPLGATSVTYDPSSST